MYDIFLYVYRGDRPHFFNVYTPVLFNFIILKSARLDVFCKQLH